MRVEPNGLAGRRLNHSAKVSKISIISTTGNLTPGICVTGRDVTNYTIAESKVLPGFEPGLLDSKSRVITITSQNLATIKVASPAGFEPAIS